MSGEIKAWTWTSGGYPKALHLSGLPSDKGPLKPSEIRVRTKAASLNPVDVQLMSYPLIAHLPNFIVPTHKGVGEDFSGIVEEAGTKLRLQVRRRGLWNLSLRPRRHASGSDQDRHRGLLCRGAEAGRLVLGASRRPPTRLAHSANDHRPGRALRQEREGCHPGRQLQLRHVRRLPRQEARLDRGGVVLRSQRRLCHESHGRGRHPSTTQRPMAFPKQSGRSRPMPLLISSGGRNVWVSPGRYVTVVGDKTDRLSPGGRYIYLWNPQMLARAVLGRIGLGRSYTCVNIEFRYSFLEEILGLPREKIVIDEVFEFNQVREAFDKLNTGRTKGKLVIRVEGS